MAEKISIRPDPGDAELAPFWQGCSERKLCIPRCSSCRRFIWYPAPTCRGCGGRNMRWEAVSGRAGLFTWVVVHRAFLPDFETRVPYVTALVELEEDPAVRMATLLEVPSAEGLRVGLPLEVFFERVDASLTIPRFRPR